MSVTDDKPDRGDQTLVNNSLYTLEKPPWVSKLISKNATDEDITIENLTLTPLHFGQGEQTKKSNVDKM